jgi:Cu(I)-responsive transcriptional regulator
MRLYRESGFGAEEEQPWSQQLADMRRNPGSVDDAHTKMDPGAATGSRVMDDKSGLSIGDLAKATGTKVETVRWYEKVGVLPAPARTAGNYRAYAPEHLNRLSFIRRGRDLGFSLDEVRALLELADQKDRDCGEVDAIARQHLADVERKIADLAALAAELRHVIGQCHGGTVSECRIIEALAPGERHLAST